MSEFVILDPVEVTKPARPSFDITPYIAEAGPDWGDAAIEQYLADAAIGQLPIDFRIPLRTITLPLLMLDRQAGMTFDQLRRAFQQKAAIFQRRGGWLKRQTSIGPVFADITGATLKFGGSTAQAMWGIDADALLTLTTIPDFYGEEIAGAVRSMAYYDSELVYVIGVAYYDVALGYGPALYWRMGANGLTDQSGNNRDGTMQVVAPVGTGPGALGSDEDGSTVFDPNASTWVGSSYSPFTAGSARTFMGWAYNDPTTTQAFHTLVYSSNGAFKFGVPHGSAGATWDVTLTVSGVSYTWVGAALAGAWFHWALVYDDAANTAELFINGVSKGVKSVAEALPGGNLQVGGYNAAAGQWMDGYIDEFSVYERKLTANEISNVYAVAPSDRPVLGNFPGRARMIVKDLANREHHGLMWAFRSRYYSSAATAHPNYKAEQLTPIAPAVLQNLPWPGGTTSKEIYKASLSTNWTAVFSTDVINVGPMTHEGSYRVIGRIRSTATPLVRFVWDVGDLVLPVENAPVRLPVTGTQAYALVDLGEVRLDAAPIGTHRWRGVLQAKGLAATDDIGCTNLWLQSLDEPHGLLTASAAVTVGLTGYTARDEFDQAAGALTGKSLPVGNGVWTVVTGSDADDFTVDATNHRIQRTTVSDTAPRRVIASLPTMTDTAVQFDFYHSLANGAMPVTSEIGQILFRYTDANNLAYAYTGADSQGRAFVGVNTRIAGSPQGVLYSTVPYFFEGWWSLLVQAFGNGAVYLWVFPQGAVPGKPLMSRSDAATAAAFKSGGTLASGKIGVGDYNPTTQAFNRYYDNFVAWVPDSDAILYPQRAAELRYDGMYRESINGGSYGPVSEVLNDLPRLPPAGLENQPTEVLIKSSDGDFGMNADTLDYLNVGQPGLAPRISTQMLYRPSYLFVSEE